MLSLLFISVHWPFKLLKWILGDQFAMYLKMDEKCRIIPLNTCKLKQDRGIFHDRLGNIYLFAFWLIYSNEL